MNDMAAPQTAGPGADQSALAALRFGWGEAYRIGWDARRGWWAQRRDNIGSDITAADADGLWEKIKDDYNRNPVPRDIPAPLGAK